MLSITPFHSSRGCLSYLVADEESKIAALIDPSQEIDTEKYLTALREQGLSLHYILETHTHADHISSAQDIKGATGAKIGMHHRSPSTHKDLTLVEETEIKLGSATLRVLETPGHTDESVSFLGDNFICTGDALLIGATGRTDFQRGDSAGLYDTLWGKLMMLPDNTIVYPAHDYKGRTQTTIRDERMTNPRLSWSKDEFITTMKNYHSEKPELFEVAIARNSA